MSTRSSCRRRKRKKLFQQQGCWYCDCIMVLPEIGQQPPLADNVATFEHLDRKGSIVIACHKCNNERS